MKLRSLLNLAFLIVLIGCGPTTVPDELIGNWETQKGPLTVRTEPKRMKFYFTKDTVTCELKISKDKTAEGRIGNATFTNGKVKPNWGLPVEMTGVSCTISFILEGKIFENDSIPKKRVEFWLGPVDEDFTAEVRYTEGGAQFPMGEFTFYRVEE